MEQQVSLYFRDGGSDKVYHAQLKAESDGFIVTFQYGRRGAALQSGTKTASPLPYEAAKKTYDKLVKEKTSKGYTPDESGTTYQGTENAGNKTDFVPQLLNPIPEEEAYRLTVESDWVMQEKKDGERRGVHVEGSNVFGMNRRGLAVPLPQPLAVEVRAKATSGTLRIDGEIIGDVLHVFDVLVYEGNAIGQSIGWIDRMALANQLFAGCQHLKPVYVARTRDEKLQLWELVNMARGEGLVFKRIGSLSKGGRPNSAGDWLKFKFTESASCIVLSVNAGKRSVAIGLLENGELISVGNVTIPANYSVPESGKIVEVEYLYAYKGGSLYQPVYLGERTDIESDACTSSQLKYKPEGCGEDEDA